jgi:hypothetical protein
VGRSDPTMTDDTEPDRLPPTDAQLRQMLTEEADRE